MKSAFYTIALAGLTAGAAAHAQPRADEEIVVTGNRLDTPIMAPARQVTQIDRDDIELQINAGASLAEVIARETPGMGQPSQTFTNYAQSLRGRNVLVLVDGVPMNTNRGVSRDLFNVSAENVENIEIVRGGNAVYGSGATGGVIFITTRRAGAGHEKETGVSFAAPTDFDSDGLSYGVHQGFYGPGEVLDYAVNLSYEHRGANFDANGDRIAPEPSQGDMFDAEVLSLSSKFGHDFGPDKRLQFSVLYHEAEQDTDYASDPGVTEQPLRSVRARAVEGLELDKQNTAENTVVSLDYFDKDIINSELHAQLFYRDYLTRFYPFDAREIPSWAHLAQSQLEATVSGGRLTIETPLNTDSTEVHWGLDAVRDESAMPVLTYDGDAYDAGDGRVFEPAGKKTFMPPITHDSRAVFSQIYHRFSEAWAADFGLRYERIDMSFNDFVTLPETLEPDPAVTPGGSVDYDATLGNAGLVFTPGDHHELYAAYNQGFELPDVGLQVRYAGPDFDIGASSLQAIETDNYEIGWRGHWDSVNASLAVYESTSELGRVQTENFGLTLSRNEEQITGVEATLDVIGERWSGGTTVTKVEGEERTGNAAEFQAMNGFRIPPLKITAYTQYRSMNWRHRLQALYSDSEDYRLNGTAAFGRRTVDSYTTVDWLSRLQLESGSIELGIENLFNEDYFPVYSQLLRSSSNTSHIPARGRTLRLSYRLRW